MHEFRCGSPNRARLGPERPAEIREFPAARLRSYAVFRTGCHDYLRLTCSTHYLAIGFAGQLTHSNGQQQCPFTYAQVKLPRSQIVPTLVSRCEGHRPCITLGA